MNTLARLVIICSFGLDTIQLLCHEAHKKNCPDMEIFSLFSEFLTFIAAHAHTRAYTLYIRKEPLVGKEIRGYGCVSTLFKQ